MRCERCGALIGNSYVRFNGTLLCDNCARDLKIDEIFRRQNSMLEQSFPSLSEIPSVFSLGSELDFANAKIRCPRCGMTLKDIDSSGQLGCIECYNTFNETILKNILKRQGSSEYLGRKPGKAAETTSNVTEPVSGQIPDAPAAKAAGEEKPQKVQPDAAQDDKAILDRLRKADLGTVPDDVLEDGMKRAAAAEDYDLAARLRDELKSRKEG
ncbi:MAG: UvrB/UvrC motif-containing protein [Clostridiales bacterium]|nr:UvrB/UvrC motif-containing protein [Clostridiales bacterium]